ncbi:MAG: acylphosphatase [Myxococcota bacterium]|nr:acylphosphatase [Myxococcota bacterium]
MKPFRARVLVSGRVQGVFFRQSTLEHARGLGLSGFVRNLPDGRVEALFVGEERAVREAVAFVHRGPPAARVSAVEVDLDPESGHDEQGPGFRVR